MNVGERIRKLRKDMKLTQDEFAKKVKLHPKQVAKYETGMTKPSIDVVSRIAEYCETSTDYIILGEDKEFAKRTKINDLELLEFFRKTNNLKKSDRDKVKWALKSLLNGNVEV